MPQMWHMLKVLHVHLWGVCGNINAMCEVAPINDVARITVQR